MEYQPWRTTLECENGHEYGFDITWFRPYIEEQDEPAGEWKPDITGITCLNPNYPDCNAPVKAVRRLYRVD
jgi:hypothetical protein